MNRTELKIEKIAGFFCPYCGEQFQDWDDCLIHILDRHVEEPEEKELWVCPVCKSKYNEEKKAQKCFKNHTIMDKENAIQRETKKTLVNVGTKPGQTTLAKAACVITKAV